MYYRFQSTAEEGTGENYERNAYDMVSVCGQTVRRINALQRQSYFCPPPPNTVNILSEYIYIYIYIYMPYICVV